MAVKILLATAACLLMGFAVGAWVSRDSAVPTATPLPQVDTVVDTGQALDKRVRDLERIIAEERDARLVLEDELLALYEQIERLTPARGDAVAPPARVVERAQRPFREANRPRDRAARLQAFQERRLAALVDGGFSEDEAQRLLRLESEAQYAAMQANYEAQRDGQPLDFFSRSRNPQSILREQLGDTEYERYLLAQGQRSAVQVTSILDGSPGRSAGLQAGDEIVSYNGERTFSMLDLRELTLQGQTGEDVVVEINRDGVRMQLSIPRGPIGVSGNGASLRGVGRWGG